MPRKKKKTVSWTDVNRSLNKFDNNQLIDLIGDLYHLSENNKVFFHTRFSLNEDPLEHYKKIIRGAIHPYLEDGETLDIGIAEGAIERYSKAANDIIGETELMIFFIESGNNFTLSYGDIDDEFYDSLLLMYEKAIQNVRELSLKDQKEFENRLFEIMNSASGIGWGYYDGLRDLYHEAFTDDP